MRSRIAIRGSVGPSDCCVVFFCPDEISFRRDYKSCRIGVVVDVDVRRPSFMGTLRLYDVFFIRQQ